MVEQFARRDWLGLALLWLGEDDVRDGFWVAYLLVFYPTYLVVPAAVWAHIAATWVTSRLGDFVLPGSWALVRPEQGQWGG